MPGLSEERIAELTEMLLEFLDAADLSDAEADAVVVILLPKLWRRSGLDLFAFRAAVNAVLLPAKADPAAIHPSEPGATPGGFGTQDRAFHCASK